MFAIVKTGGKQYRVGPGDQIVVERIAGDVGAEVALDEVLAISDGELNALGTPTVANASVRAKIVQQPRGTKVLVFKKKRRKNYRRKRGHRQELTVLRIEEISRGATAVAPDSGEAPVIASDGDATPTESNLG
jgi:large subunit ribosomal protein L21